MVKMTVNGVSTFYTGKRGQEKPVFAIPFDVEFNRYFDRVWKERNVRKAEELIAEEARQKTERVEASEKNAQELIAEEARQKTEPQVTSKRARKRAAAKNRLAEVVVCNLVQTLNISTPAESVPEIDDAITRLEESANAPEVVVCSLPAESVPEIEDACVVCLDAERVCVFVPCGHLAICKACVARLGSNPLCPICKSDSTAIIKMFRV